MAKTFAVTSSDFTEALYRWMYDKSSDSELGIEVLLLQPVSGNENCEERTNEQLLDTVIQGNDGRPCHHCTMPHLSELDDINEKGFITTMHQM